MIDDDTTHRELVGELTRLINEADSAMAAPALFESLRERSLNAGEAP